MSAYTKITNSEALEIMKLYQKDAQVKEITPLSLGISNSNYKVTMVTGKEYLLKVANDKSVEELSKELKILEELSELEFPFVVPPLKTAQNESYYQLKTYYGAVFPFIKGIPPGPNDYTCHEIGKALAALHQVKFKQKHRSFDELGFNLSHIKAYAKSSKAEPFFKTAYFELLDEGSTDYIEQEFQRGLIHGDLYYDNTLFKSEKIAALFDFEQAGVGPLILDIGISISGTCIEKGRIKLELIKSYLNGYESIRKLSKEENAYLNYAITLGLFSISLWRIKRFTEGTINPTMKESYKDLLIRAYNFNRELHEY